MKKLDLSLYLVLDPSFFANTESLLNTAHSAATNGVSLVQLRAKMLNKKDFYLLAQKLKKLLDTLNMPLIINDHVDIALAIDADGVHIGQHDLPVNITRKLIGEQKWLGLSVSNSTQLEHADISMIDYLGVGPIFPTSTKQDAAAALGLETLKRLMQQKPCPCVAIGGITELNAAQIMRCNVDGLAVVSAICAQKNPSEATQILLKNSSVKFSSQS